MSEDEKGRWPTAEELRKMALGQQMRESYDGETVALDRDALAATLADKCVFTVIDSVVSQLERLATGANRHVVNNKKAIGAKKEMLQRMFGCDEHTTFSELQDSDSDEYGRILNNLVGIKERFTSITF